LLGAALGARYSSNAIVNIGVGRNIPASDIGGPDFGGLFLGRPTVETGLGRDHRHGDRGGNPSSDICGRWYDRPRVQLEVMTANLMLGEAAAETVVESAKAHADVLVVQEHTPDLLDQLSVAGLDEEFPCRAVDPRPVLAGSGCGAGTR
jgi:hypothetical protein